jgi:hypothetical protein
VVTDTGRGHWRRSLAGDREMGIGWLLFAVLGAPVAWSLHFLLIYFLVTLFCTTGSRGAGVAVGIATALFAVISAAAGVVAYRGWRRTGAAGGWDRAVTEADQHRSSFLLMMGMLAGALFTLLIFTEALPTLFVQACPEVPR